MGRERTRGAPLKRISDVNMTPLIDLTFLLLITFILAFPMIEQGIKIRLPRANADRLDEQKPQTITIKYAGGIYLNDRETTPEALGEALGAIAAQDPQPPVLVRCDERVEYGQMVKTLKILHDCRITRMALVTEPAK